MSDDEGPPLFPGPEHRFPGPPASDGSAFAGEDGNFDGWEDDEGVPTWSLVRPRVLCDSAGFAMLHDVQTHGFDLRRRCDELRLDSLARIRLVNWIRSGEEGARGVEEIAGLKGDERWLVEGEEWLKPVIEDDGMLRAWLPRTVSNALNLVALQRLTSETKRTRSAGCGKGWPTSRASWRLPGPS